MSDLTFYLSGACSESREYYCREWRKESKKEIKRRCPESKVINPLEDKDLSVDYNARKLVEEDLEYVGLSDVIIAEMLLDDYAYIGTSMELFYAFQLGIPIFVATRFENNYFLDYVATETFLSIKTATRAAVSRFEGA